MRRQAVNAARPVGSTNVVANLLATAERTLQRGSEAPRKAVHNFFLEATSSPDGPAALSMCRIVQWMRTPSKLSNRTGGGGEKVDGDTKTEGFGK